MRYRRRLLCLIAIRASTDAAEVNLAPGANLQEALDAVSSGSTLVLANGTYNNNGTMVTSHALFEISKDITLRASSSEQAILDG
eukprot:7387066-Prymnesium_polylepis.1